MNDESGFNRFLRWETTTRDTIDFKKTYVDMTGDLIAGLLLSQIVYWHLPDKKGQSKLRVYKDGFYWIAKQRDDWWDEVRIRPKRFDRACDILVKKGIVVKAYYRFNGLRMMHLRIDHSVFMELWEQGVSPQSPDGEDRPDPTVNPLTETTTEITTKKIAEAAETPKTSDPPPIISVQHHHGLRAVRSTSTEEVVLEIHDQQDRYINCPACQTSTTEWPTTEAERRKPESLRCTGCGAFLIVHGYTSYSGKERTYKHPHLPEPGWRVEITMADESVRVMEGITDAQLKEFARYWERCPVLCMEKLLWLDEQEWSQWRSQSEKLGLVCSSVETSLRNKAGKESLEAELTEKEPDMPKMPEGWLDTEAEWMQDR